MPQMEPIRKAYLETSAINHAADKGLNAQDIRNALRKAGYVPAIGIHSIFELAMTLRSPEGSERGKQLFRLVLNLDASAQMSAPELFELEYADFRDATTVIPFRGYSACRLLDKELARMAEGFLDDRARFLMENHDAKYWDFRPQMLAYAQIYADQKKSFRDFDDFFEQTSNQIPRIIYEMASVSQECAEKMARQLNKVPAIRTGVRCNVYLSYLVIKNQTAAARHLMNDQRHAVEATYCDAVVTCDDGFYKSLAVLNPKLKPIRSEDLW